MADPNSSDAGEVIREFEALRPQYVAFTESLASLITTLLTTGEIEYFQIEPRTKEVSSFSDKIQREDKQGKYQSASDVTDLTGIRIIAYLKEDCDKIESLIETHFEVDEKNSVRKEDELAPDKFGYLSTHFVVSLPDSRLALPEFKRFAGLKGEIQIRTLLQHTWAAIDWKFRYKEEREAPKQLRRRLFRISALLEAADNEFSSVKTELDVLRKSYAEAIGRRQLDIAVNTESLRSYSKESSVWASVVNAAKLAGLNSMRFANAGALDRFIKTLDILNIKTLAQLDGELTRIQPEVEKLYKYVVPRGKTLNPDRQPQLLEAAVVRYALFAFAPPSKRKAISGSAALSPGYAKIISEYAEERGRSG